MPYKIMLIDDDTTALVLLGAKLREFLDVTVESTTNPLEALSLAKSFQPNLIVCDINMEPCDGGDVARELREDEATRSIPFVYLSSLIDPEQVSRNKGLIGGKRIISKQSSFKEIIHQLCLESGLPFPGPGLTRIPFSLAPGSKAVS